MAMLTGILIGVVVTVALLGATVLLAMNLDPPKTPYEDD